MSRRSRPCLRAQQDARAHDIPSQTLIDLLNEPIRSDETQRIRRRVERLVVLFKSLDAPRARRLLARLNDPGDALGRLFDCELSTAFRNQLRELLAFPLRERFERSKSEPPATEPSPTVPPEPEPPEEEPPPEEEEPPPEEEPPEDEPPPEPPSFPVIPDLAKFLRDLLRWIRERRDGATGGRFLERLARLENLVDNALGLLQRAIVAGAIGYFAYHAIRRRLVQVVATSALDYASVRVVSYFTHSTEFGDLEKTLDEIFDILDEVKEADRVERQLQEEFSKIRVQPTTRGFSVEAFRKQVLFQQGYEPTPGNFPGLDAIRGKSRVENGVRVYRNAEGISVKSTDKTTPGYLLGEFERKWLPDLVKPDAGWRKPHGNFRVVSLKKKAIQLVFEEGTVPNIGPETVRELRTIQKRAKRAGVDFEWFVFAQGEEVSGPTFLERMRLGE